MGALRGQGFTNRARSGIEIYQVNSKWFYILYEYGGLTLSCLIRVASSRSSQSFTNTSLMSAGRATSSLTIASVQRPLSCRSVYLYTAVRNQWSGNVDVSCGD